MELNHEQITFLRECLVKRIEGATNSMVGDDKMHDTYLNGIVEDAKELLNIITPCCSVTIN